jgi:hypothetical protein
MGVHVETNKKQGNCVLKPLSNLKGGKILYKDKSGCEDNTKLHLGDRLIGNCLRSVGFYEETNCLITFLQN